MHISYHKHCLPCPWIFSIDPFLSYRRHLTIILHMTVQLIHVQVRTTHTVSKRQKKRFRKNSLCRKNRQKQNGLIYCCYMTVWKQNVTLTAMRNLFIPTWSESLFEILLFLKKIMILQTLNNSFWFSNKLGWERLSWPIKMSVFISLRQSIHNYYILYLKCSKFDH